MTNTEKQQHNDLDQITRDLENKVKLVVEDEIVDNNKDIKTPPSTPPSTPRGGNTPTTTTLNNTPSNNSPIKSKTLSSLKKQNSNLTPSGTPKKTLKNFIQYQVITEKDFVTCYFQFKNLHHPVNIIGFNDYNNAAFTIQSPINKDHLITESSATTLIKKYLLELNDPSITIPKTFEGNKFMYINYKRMEEYVITNAPVPLTKTTSSPILLTPTSSNNNNNNNNELTPGQGETPYKISNNISYVQASPNPSRNNSNLLEAFTNANNNNDNNIINIEYEFQQILETTGEEKISTAETSVVVVKGENAKIKASGIGRYFHFGCDKYLSYSTRSSIPLSNNTITDIQNELIKDGFRWESKVLEYLENKYDKKEIKERIFKPKQPEQSDITFEETLRIFKEEKGDFYVFQSTLEPPKSFRRSLPEFIQFSISKPDYLKINTTENGIRIIQIQDAKSTNSITFSQKIQLAFYYLLLNCIIKEQGLESNLKVSDIAGIYLKDNYKLEEFSLLNSVKILEDFLFGSSIKKQSQIIEILQKPKETSEWILSERCDGCEFLDLCTNQAKSEKSINSLANVDHMALRSLLAATTTPSSNDKSEVESLASLKQKDIQDRLLQIEYLKTKSTVKGFLEKKVYSSDLYDYRMSSYEDIEVYITLLHNPLESSSNSITQWAIKVVDNTTNTNQFSEDTSIKSLIFTLNSIFTVCNKSGRSMQSYIFDSFERSLFFGNCFQELKEINDKTSHQVSQENHEYLNAIMVVLRTLLYSCKDWLNLGFIQYPEAILVGSFSMKSVYQEDTSFLLIKDLVKKSLVLSDLNPNYTFEKIVFELFLKDSSTKDGFKLPNSLNSDYIFNLMKKHSSSGDELIEISHERLNYSSSIIKELKDIVFLKKQIQKPSLPFQIRNIIKYSNENLKKLYFCYQQENLSTFRKIKSKRSNPLEFNLLSGDYLLFEYVNSFDEGKNSRVILKSNIYQSHLNRFNVLFEKLAFNSLFLLPKSKYNELLQLNDNAFTELKSSDSYQQILDMTVESKEVSMLDSNVFNITMKFKVASKDLFKDSVAGSSEFILFDTFNIKYWQMHKNLLSNYSKFDKDTPSIFLGLLDQPLDCLKPPITDGLSPAELLEIAGNVKLAIEDSFSNNPDSKLKMTPSQERIFESLIQRRLQLILGPPGTGKTHFLALVVLILMEVHKRLGKPFKVVITSHTHTAIDNLLLRVAALKQVYQREIGTDLNFHICKKSTSKDNLKFLSSKGVESFDSKTDLEKEYLCLGSTCWGLGNLSNTDIDLLIIDEASQLNSYIGILAFNRLNPQTGRIIVCGDSKQLGPVLGDIYSSGYSLKSKILTKEERYQTKLHKSVFSCLKSLLKRYDPSSPYLSLNENFRMNQELCEFSSKTLYGDLYRCFDPNQSKVDVYSPEKLLNESVLINSIFSSERSCHTILLKPSEFGNKYLEAEIVRQIYLFLNPQSLNKTNPGGNSREKEQEFWDSELGVITPLHDQRNLITPMIHQLQLGEILLPNIVDPTVNTVETIQGQEFNNIILCYNGFQEKTRISEFSFNLNRLNVGFTRSKKRFILIASEKLLQPDEYIFNNKKTSVAYDHLLAYIQSSQIHRFNINKTSPVTLNNNENPPTLLSETLVEKLSELTLTK